MFFNEYPYRNLTDLNLDFLLKAIGEMQNEVKNFVTLNAVKYADPIQWSITTQYEKNTIVIDPLTGTAYISVQPVPSGVALNRTEYWTPVFDLSRFIVGANKNFTANVEDDGVIYSTFALSVGDWVVWNGELYEALVNMPIGTAYSIGGNIKRITVEDFVKTAISNLENSITTLDNEIGDLTNLTTTDKTSVVNAINEVNHLGNDAITMIGDLNDLTTSDKSNLVNAINEVNDNWSPELIINVTRLDPSWGLTNLVGDGVTDNASAFRALLTYVGGLTWARCSLFFPNGIYYLESQVTLPSYVSLIGEGTLSTAIRTTGTSADLIVLSGYNEISNMNITCMSANSAAAAFSIIGGQCIVERVRIYNFKTGIVATDANGLKTYLLYIQSNVANCKGISFNGRCVSSKITKTTMYVTDSVTTGVAFSYDSGDYCMDIQFIECESAFVYRAIVLNAATTTYPGDILIKGCIFDGMYDTVVRYADANNSGNLIIADCWINYRPTSSTHTIFTIANSHNVIIHNNRIATLNIGGSEYLRAIGVTNSDNVIIIGNDFHNMQYIVNASGCGHINIANNNIANISGTNGTALFNIATSSEFIIEGNICDGNYTYTAIISTLTNSIIKNNIFKTVNALSYTEASCLISDNIL